MSNPTEEKYIKIHATLNKIMFPRPPKILGEGEMGDNYGIVTWNIVSVDEGEPAESRYGTVTIKGPYETGINSKLVYVLYAKQLEDSDYGPQYRLVYYNTDLDFSKVSNQRAFLKTILTESQLEELFKVCPNPLEAISNHDIIALKKAKGIGDYIAKRIIRSFEETKDYSSVYLELDELGFTTNFVSKLITTYKSPQTVIDVIKKDPYRLIYDMDGVGFLTADKIALGYHYTEQDVRRLKAYIIWFLQQQGEEGHSYITVGELLACMYGDLGGKDLITEIYKNPEEHDGETSNIALAIKQLQDEDLVVVEDSQNISKANRRIYLKKIWKLERDIAYHLKRLLNAHNEFVAEDFDTKIAEAEKKQGFTFTDEQIEGIKLGLKSQVCLISGLAGSGKSSLVSGILAVLNKYTFAQCALAGKAAARLQEVTGQEGQTIHRLLGYNVNGFTYNEECQLPYDIIILDEISMIGGEIFLDLLKAIPSGSKLYILGDLGQLESVGLLNLAADLYHSSVIPMVDLKQVHRQAKASGILTTAYNVRKQVQLFEEDNYEGQQIIGEKKDMILDCSPERYENKDRVLRYYQKCFEGQIVQKDIEKIEIISPVRERGDTCVFNFNQEVQNYVNPVDGTKPNFFVKKNKSASGKDFSYWLQEGDKVMCIKNNYHLTDITGSSTEIFNGWTGVIKKIIELPHGTSNLSGQYDFLIPYLTSINNYDEYSAMIPNRVAIMIIYFPLGGTEVCIPLKDVSSHIVLGYACTCHKMQGSSAEVIICVINWETPPSMLTSQLIYTMITRAKKKCIFVCQSPALKKAISTDFVSTKRTFLPEFLEIDLSNLQAEYNKDKQKDLEKKKEQIQARMCFGCFNQVLEDEQEFDD